jgi:hypothetical protein
MTKQATIEVLRYRWAITMETVFSVGPDSRLYNEDPRSAEINLKESLKMAVEDD